MLLLRQLTPFVRTPTRFYVKKEVLGAVAHKKMKQIHQETLRHINPLARINIRSDIYLKVRSADVHEYPGGDVFIAQLFGDHVKNCTASMKIHVSDDEKQVNLQIAQIADDTNFHCEVEIPIRADLNIECKNGVNIKNIYDEDLRVVAKNNILAKNIRSGTISLYSEDGSISCNGLLLAKNSTVETKQEGNITLDKLQGDNLLCKTNKGAININSCYVESSKFETNCGCLNLKNVHKKTEVHVHQKGDLHMTGVHGNFHIQSNGGDLDLQLSELYGENVIMAENTDKAVLNIADAIEENSYIELKATSIKLDDSLSHLIDCIDEDQQCFRLSQERDNQNKLIATIKGEVKMGKLSWADSMRVTMGLNDKN